MLEGVEMKTNKEVIDDLQAYFLKQDPKDIARTLAGLMIDFQRFVNYENLGKNEQECLLFRMQKNVEELQRFIREGPRDNDTFKYINLESKEQE